MAGRLCVVDFDGTIYSNEQGLDRQSLAALMRLPQQDIAVALATGRSAFSLRRTLNGVRLPVDFAIFSTGALVINYHSGEELFDSRFDRQQRCLVCRRLAAAEIDYCAHLCAPHNHHFLHSPLLQNDNPDFMRRFELYQNFGAAISAEKNTCPDISQFLAIIPPNNNRELPFLQQLQNQHLSVVRTTSPTDGESLWLEIFPGSISKKSGVEWLLEYLQLDIRSVMAVGNDFNDLDILRAAKYSFVVDNAPEILKQEFRVVNGCGNGGVAQAIDIWLRESSTPSRLELRLKKGEEPRAKGLEYGKREQI